MKKLSLLVAGLMLTGLSYACDGGKDGKNCCKKGDKAKTAQKACCKKGDATASNNKSDCSKGDDANAKNGKACCKKGAVATTTTTPAAEPAK